MVKIVRVSAFSLLIAIVLSMALSAVTHYKAAAGVGLADIYVDGTWGSDSYDGSSPIPVSPTVGPKDTITHGVNVVADNGTVHVAAGTYNEFVHLGIEMSLIGEDAVTTIIDGGGDGHPVVSVSSAPYQHNTISGFTIRNGCPGAFGSGGGIYVSSNHIVTLTDCIIIDNVKGGGAGPVPDRGGGICVEGGFLYMDNCTVSGNTASGFGGGIYTTFTDGGFTGQAELTNSTISGNTVTSVGACGAGICAQNAPLTFLNVTLADNHATGSASYGGGFANISDSHDPVAFCKFKNCIVAGNTAGDGIHNNGYDVFNGAGIQTQGYNIDSENSCHFDPTATDMVDTDPLLGPLQDNGGPTFTHAIAQTSPAFNGAADGPATDQRGFTRPMLGGYDIGAYELQTLVPPDVTSCSPNSGIQGQTLDVTITGNYFTGATSVSFGTFGSYINVNSKTVDNDTQITANITILPYATPGTRNVRVTTPAGNGTLVDGFTVNRAGVLTQSVQTATGTGTATFTTDGASISNLTASGATACGALEGYSFPHGFFSFSLANFHAGSTVVLTITFPSAVPAGTQYWKCINGHWVDCTSLLGSNDGDNVLTLTIIDGGLGDADGAVNGSISDPGGPATPVTRIVMSTGPQSSSASIPTPASQAPVSLPNIYVQSASLSAASAAPGAELTVNASVANRGTVNGITRVRLYINGRLDSEKAVTISSGGQMPVSFTVSRSEPGTYQVYVNGTNAGSFTVSDNSTILYFSIACIFLAFVLGVILIYRKFAA
ncbi:MAG: choice-of-anchor U domain-containing protein [Dehalococcoidia bacterium]